jgi:hypothetical protein
MRSCIAIKRLSAEISGFWRLRNIIRVVDEILCLFSVADPDHFDADPDPDPTSEKKPDPDPDPTDKS